MIRMVQSVSAAHAKSYYSDALLKSDYYLEDQELGGDFRGLLADRLGLTGRVTKDDFFALCENQHPVTGDQLTPRTNDNRTTGYDINFHVPKSVSLVHVLSGDDHILEAFRASVHETMADIEADAETRVRKNGAYADRTTGELLWTDFIHQTARPVGNQEPDPHLHAHCYVFNATWDKEEDGGRCKAGQFRDIKRDMPYYQAMFQKRLSDKLIRLGYEVRRTKKSFEIEGVPQRALNHFSKRTDEIGRIAREKGITDAKALDALGARTRAKKQKGLTMPELKAGWRQQIRRLGNLQEEGSQPLRNGPAKEAKSISAERSLNFSLSHHFEKASVMPARRLLATAYSQSIGDAKTTIEEVHERFKNDPALIEVEEHGQMVCTTKEALREEKRMVAMARMGRGKMTPLYDKAPKVQLKEQQGEAIKHLLTTSDRVSIVRGAAGTGKTTLMQEAVRWMQEAGKQVTVVAPTSVAARDVLRGEGFEKANTVAALFESREMQDKLQNGILWVDEAGMLGTHDMTSLLELATQKNARLILGGDTRQHSAVARGDALRIISQLGKIKSAEVSKIYRQKNAGYRDAVQSLSSGKIKEGFEQLDKMGAIVDVDAQKPNTQLVEDYIGVLKKGRNAIVISPTNGHRKELTEDIRKAMRKEGMIGKKEIITDRLENLHLSQAEKDQWKTYEPGQVIQFTLPTTGIRRGSRWTVKEVSEKQIIIAEAATGKRTELPQGRSKCFDVLAYSEILLAKGDQVKVTRNSYDQSKKRMDNGQLLEVLSVKKNGRIELQNKISKQVYHIDDRFGHLDHAHCVTSYASQGKTVDEVLIAQPAATFPGTNAKQFYVSASRAKEAIRIYTDDKATLLAHAQRSGDRTSALEVAAMKKHEEHIHHQQREDYAAPDPPKYPDKDISLPFPNKIDRNYEPGF